MIKVSTSNWYYKNARPQRDAKYLVSFGIDIGGVQEGHGGNAQDIKAALRNTYDVWWADRRASHEKDYAALDCPVIIKHGLNVERKWWHLISHRAQKKDIGMPRGATAVRFKKDGMWVTFINTHTNAAVQGPRGRHLSTRIKRVREYILGMQVLEKMVENAKARGDEVILVGDLNYKTWAGGIWKWSPAGLFKRCKMHYRHSGLDYIGYTRGLKCTRLQIIPASRTGSDHPWLIATLVKS